jgi:hypothetical protein
MKTKLLGIFVSVLFLTSCGQIVDIAMNEPNIDFNADVEAIGLGVQKFDANSSTSANVETFEDYKYITEKNREILSEIDASTDKFILNIERAGSRLPEVDSLESPSRSKMLAWAEGYKSWIYFQMKSQELGEECLEYPSEWMSCLLNKFPLSSENQTLSTIKLNAAIQGIQEWRTFVGQ